MESVLQISKVGFPAWSLRDCQQKLYPIKTPALRRTINGSLISILPRSHQKYATIIECQDKQSPAMEQLWIGDAVQVSCIQPLMQEFDTNLIQLSRPAVQGSVTVYDEYNMSLEFNQDGQRIILTENFKGYARYRPILEMRLKSFHLRNQEWALRTDWQIELEEI